MATTFITGDRQLSPIYPTLVLIEMMRALVNGDTIVTGVNSGVEQMVREVAETVGLEVLAVENPLTVEGYVDWDARHFGVSEDTNFIAVHADPHESRVVKSLLALPQDRVRLVTPVDLLG